MTFIRSTNNKKNKKLSNCKTTTKKKTECCDMCLTSETDKLDKKTKLF